MTGSLPFVGRNATGVSKAGGEHIDNGRRTKFFAKGMKIIFTLAAD
jgi:hypothetical protein